MNELITINNVNAYLDKDGIAYLKLEDVVRGLGIVKRDIKNGKEYIRIDKTRVFEYLETFGNKIPKIEDEYIPENIFYKLCMKANNEVARKFQDLVCDEILPAIRKHGMYATNETIEKILDNPDFGIKLLTTLKEEKDKNRKLEFKIEEMQPKVVFADAVSASKSSILIGELAKLLRQNGINIGQNRLFEWLREHGYLIRKFGNSYNLPTQRSMDLDLFEIKETAITRGTGDIQISTTPKVTGKGQQYFIKYFLNNKLN